MYVLKRWKYAIVLSALALALSACTSGGDEAKTPEAEPKPVAEPAPEQRPADEPKPEVEPPAQEQPAPDAGKTPAEQPKDAAELPETTELEVTLEGMPEKVKATLAKSEQGYALYVMDGFEFTPEEPSKDQVFFKNAPEYYFQIQKLPSDASAEDLKANAEAQLEAVGGDIVEMKGEEINAAVRDEVTFFLHSSTSELSRNIALIEKNGARFLVTMNMPNGEAAEGATPRFLPMIDSIVATK
ncbi:hypothetical protein MO973_27020 [Paenibacillus sp. TRM 82003]|nr:hypothetical protein [Paenibacillus sp. TRM 82003]